jgi:hypothetical protein
VGGVSKPTRRARAAAAALALSCAPLLGGCAANGYAGIPFAAGAADPELQALARAAQGGDKRAHLELGIRYEEARGVPLDLARAERLYRLAARDTGGRVWTHSPGVKSVPGSPMLANLGPRQPGLREARQRLSRLARRSPSDRGAE